MIQDLEGRLHAAAASLPPAPPLPDATRVLIRGLVEQKRASATGVARRRGRRGSMGGVLAIALALLGAGLAVAGVSRVVDLGPGTHFTDPDVPSHVTVPETSYVVPAGAAELVDPMTLRVARVTPTRVFLVGAGQEDELTCLVSIDPDAPDAPATVGCDPSAIAHSKGFYLRRDATGAITGAVYRAP